METKMKTHTGSTTMSGQAVLWALYQSKQSKNPVPYTYRSCNFRREFLDWCEIQNDELISNTGALA
jgi:hypothetical protein